MYKRVLIKLSGEALAGDKKTGLDYDVVQSICSSIKKIYDLGTEVAIVVGGGNFWRGRSSGNMDRTRADHIGMLATVMNSLALADALEQVGCDVRVQTAISMQQVAEPYIRNRAVRHLQKNRVVIFGCGTGNPFSPPILRQRCAQLKLTLRLSSESDNVDSVYDSDRTKNPNAVRYQNISFDEVLAKQLAVMDMTAFSMCRDNHILVLVFSLEDPDNILRAVKGEDVGTLVNSQNDLLNFFRRTEDFMKAGTKKSKKK